MIANIWAITRRKKAGWADYNGNRRSARDERAAGSFQVVRACVNVYMHTHPPLRLQRMNRRIYLRNDWLYGRIYQTHIEGFAYIIPALMWAHRYEKTFQSWWWWVVGTQSIDRLVSLCMFVVHIITASVLVFVLMSTNDARARCRLYNATWPVHLSGSNCLGSRCALKNMPTHVRRLEIPCCSGERASGARRGAWTHNTLRLELCWAFCRACLWLKQPLLIL